MIVCTGMTRIATMLAVLAVMLLPRVASSRDERDDKQLLILVNTPDELYRVDPATFDVTSLGTFTFPGAVVPDRITDIAVDRKGRMWAIGFEAVYAVDPTTLECTLLMRHPGKELNSLAIVTSAMVTGREQPDLMLAAEANGSVVYLVDAKTGALAPIGDLGGGLVSSGDLTWAPGVGAVQIVSDLAGYEGLARLDANTFTANKIGSGWAFAKVRGLTMLPSGLLAVTEQGEMLEIDTATGAATLRKTHPLTFYGGAVGWHAQKR
jgi:hypothetical protein